MGFKDRKASSIIDAVKETLTEALPVEEVKEEETPMIPDLPTEEEQEELENISVVVDIEPKKPRYKAERKGTLKKKKKIIKKRVDTKPAINCGITGDTVEVREFRAIVKKDNKQINVVLNGILAEWNHLHYNL